MVEKDLIRETIIETSRLIFGRLGFRKTTMEDIAQGINKGKSSIYYYFDSKEDIFKAVIEKEALFIQTEVTKAMDQASTPTEKLKTYIFIRLKLFLQASSFYEAVRSEYLTHLDFVNKIREKYDQDEMQMLKKLLIDGQAAEEFVINNTELTSIAIVTVIRGLEIPLLKFSHPTGEDERIENLLRILFYGIVRK